MATSNVLDFASPGSCQSTKGKKDEKSAESWPDCTDRLVKGDLGGKNGVALGLPWFFGQLGGDQFLWSICFSWDSKLIGL